MASLATAHACKKSVKRLRHMFQETTLHARQELPPDRLPYDGRATASFYRSSVVVSPIGSCSPAHTEATRGRLRMQINRSLVASLLHEEAIDEGKPEFALRCCPSINAFLIETSLHQ